MDPSVEMRGGLKIYDSVILNQFVWYIRIVRGSLFWRL